MHIMWIVALDVFTGYVFICYKSTCLHRLGIANFLFRHVGTRLFRPSLPAPLPLSLICTFINSISTSHMSWYVARVAFSFFLASSSFFRLEIMARPLSYSETQLTSNPVTCSRRGKLLPSSDKPSCALPSFEEGGRISGRGTLFALVLHRSTCFNSLSVKKNGLCYSLKS